MRAYYLPTTIDAQGEQPISEFMGATPFTTPLEWSHFLKKLVHAKFSGYEKIIFPPGFLAWSHSEQAIAHAQEQGFAVQLQWTADEVNAYTKQLIESIAQRNCFVELVVTRDSEQIPLCWQRLKSHFDNKWLVFTVLFTRHLRHTKFFRRFAKKQLTFQLYFPTHHGSNSNLYSPRQAQSIVTKLRESHTDSVFMPPVEIDIFEPRVGTSLKIEPSSAPNWMLKTTTPNVQISVIIPTYNNKTYISVVVQHLLEQNLAGPKYEIIIVDDGSDDQTEAAINKIAEAAHLNSELNFTYIYFPRQTERSMGDNQFRAGIARNLGVKYASGNILAFLDSDIVVGKDYLQNLLDLHKTNDVVQGRRFELTKEKSHKNTCYEKISVKDDTYIVDHGHWETFLSGKTPWNEIPSGWEYTCTHSLSITTSWFKKMGWFRKTFIFYGFEDTELGFRLWRAGARFKLNEQKVFHLYHADQRSEFGNSHAHKIFLLMGSYR